MVASAAPYGLTSSPSAIGFSDAALLSATSADERITWLTAVSDAASRKVRRSIGILSPEVRWRPLSFHHSRAAANPGISRTWRPRACCPESSRYTSSLRAWHGGKEEHRRAAGLASILDSRRPGR